MGEKTSHRYLSICCPYQVRHQEQLYGYEDDNSLQNPMYEEYRYIRCQLPDTLNLSPARPEWMMQHDTVHHTKVSDCYNDRIQFLRNCEYYMIIGCIKYVLFLCINPFLFRKLLAHGTASASAGVIMNADTSAVLTNTDVYTKSACFTVHDMISCFL